MRVLAPCPGRLVALAQVPDPVFAGEIVGPGVAIDPDPGRGTVISPIGGKVVKIHPHAFVVFGEPDQVGVLVHLGLNTVKLEGRGFEVLVPEGATVTAGDPIVRWNPSDITGSGDTEGMSPLVPVIAMDRPAGSVDVGSERTVAVGELLFEV